MSLPHALSFDSIFGSKLYLDKLIVLRHPGNVCISLCQLYFYPMCVFVQHFLHCKVHFLFRPAEYGFARKNDFHDARKNDFHDGSLPVEVHKADKSHSTLLSQLSTGVTSLANKSLLFLCVIHAITSHIVASAEGQSLANLQRTPWISKAR